MQRRFGLERRCALVAAGAVLMGVLGCFNSNTSAFAVDKSFSLEQFLFSLSPQQDVSSSPASVALNPDPKVVTANTTFGFKLFSEVLKEDTNKNVFISPSSVAFALAITYNGASGSTQEAMANALELQGISLDQLNSANADLKTFLENSDPEVKLTIANSLWVRQDFTLKPEFIQKNQDFYKAEVTNLNFNDPGAPGIINKWVQDNTQGKINQIVDKIDRNQVLFLINAIYFKGNWTNKFDKNKTADYPFYLTSGEQKEYPMMSQTGNYKYYENELFQAISLPYGKDGKFSFYVFLPKENSSLNAFYETLNTENWEKWISNFSQQKGFIRLPRFKIEYDVTLNDALTALGMGEAFSDEADFSGIADQSLKISQVKHKTFIEVNEEGTEAAAVTSVGVVATSVVFSPPPFQMIVDRPFFSAIRENGTGTILFMGSIVDPGS
ncbi:MAG: serpin family protein [Stigonema ocellatum SAG 48.90 = DSM 106950]|nr:serpin family protein [Stigonema ocellatum SAG 48.90 = DSM 106950]